jgi:hypothetical protein
MTAEPVQLAPEVEVLALAELAKRVAERYKLAKALVGQSYPDGRRETFRSPLDGTRLGMVYRTDPDPHWVVTDAEALDAELRTYPGNLVTFYEIADEQTAIDVLHSVAPHLLVEATRVRPDAVAAALAQSEATGVAAASGIEQVKPSGVLTPKPDAKTAGPAIERMVAAGLLTWDMRPVLPAVDEGVRASAAAVEETGAA